MSSSLLLTRNLFLLALVLAFGAGSLGCSDTTEPGPGQPEDGWGWFTGAVDPDDGTFELESVQGTGDGVPVQIRLVGRGLEVDPAAEIVSLEVAVENADTRRLFPPAEIVIGDLNPRSVMVANPDWTTCPDSLIDVLFPENCEYGFDYSTLLGEDGALEPGERSGFRRWQFRVPGLTGFSFGVSARFGMDPGRPVIAGVFFDDRNANGVHDPEEGPAPGGVRVTGPGVQREIAVDPSGRWSVAVREPGLYLLEGFPPPIMAPIPIIFTTTNPLQVVLPPGPDGLLQSFTDADFGLHFGFDPGKFPPVILIEALDDSVKLDTYDLMNIRLDGYVLHLQVGFGGCSEDHPFQLYMVGSFMESIPVQARLVLSHDSRGELCEAYWQRNLGYDLRPIQEEHRRIYGGAGPVILDFMDAMGDHHRLRLEP